MKLPVKALLEWYKKNKRDLPWRKTGDSYSIWLSEVMLQQTQVNTVIPYYLKFLERFPTIVSLADGSEQDLLKLWEGLGYYSRARNLHRAAGVVKNKYSGIIPGTPGEFGELPGVGPYITAAVLSIARDVSLPSVDGNVTRVYTRFMGIADDITRNSTKKRITLELQEIIPPGSAGDFNQAMMELGALVCSPRTPRCEVCPLNKSCTAYKSGTVNLYPYKPPNPGVPEYKVSIGIILQNDCFYIQKRPSEGHLGGLWEFPGGKAKNHETPEQTLIRECAEELGATVRILEKLTLVRHAYSHFKISMSVFLCALTGDRDIHPSPGIDYRWITADELDDYPFPGANHKFFPTLKSFLLPGKTRQNPGGS